MSSYYVRCSYDGYGSLTTTPSGTCEGGAWLTIQAIPSTGEQLLDLWALTEDGYVAVNVTEEQSIRMPHADLSIYAEFTQNSPEPPEPPIPPTPPAPPWNRTWGVILFKRRDWWRY